MATASTRAARPSGARTSPQRPRLHGGFAAVRGAALAALVATVASCGGGGASNTPTAPVTPPTADVVVITLSGNAASPAQVQIAPGQRVRFVNNDARAHDMVSDPHPEHTDCPEINQAGFLQPGQLKETGNFVTAKSCGFHDHDQPSVSGLKGRIVVR